VSRDRSAHSLLITVPRADALSIIVTLVRNIPSSNSGRPQCWAMILPSQPKPSTLTVCAEVGYKSRTQATRQDILPYRCHRLQSQPDSPDVPSSTTCLPLLPWHPPSGLCWSGSCLSSPPKVVPLPALTSEISWSREGTSRPSPRSATLSASARPSAMQPAPAPGATTGGRVSWG
jgi:hypothetical protein